MQTLSTTARSARSAYEILGLPQPAGLAPLPADQSGKVPFIDQRVELTSLLRATLAEAGFRRLRKKIEDGEASDEEKEAAAQYKSKPNLMDWPDVEAFFDRVAADIPASRQSIFEEHRALARKGAQDGKLPDGAPRLNLDDPERQLLWAATIVHAFANGKIPAADFMFHPLVKPVVNSRFVDGMFNRLAMDLPGQCRLITGAPGSWFFFSPDPRMPRVNLDLCYCLIAGGGLYPLQGGYLGHYEPIAHHEIGHSRFSKFYPKSIQKIWARMATIAAKGGMQLPDAFMPDGSPTPKFPKGSAITIEEFKEFLTLDAEFRMRQRFWNACEDNCVNRYSVNLGDPDHIPEATLRHKGNLADSQNVARTIIEAAFAIHNYYNPKPGDAAPDEDKTSAKNRLGNLSHAVNMAFYFRNRMAPDTPEGRAAIGVDVDLFPADTHEARLAMWEYIRECARRIEELQPHALDTPGRMYQVPDIHTGRMHRVNYDGKVKLYNEWRNEEIEKLLRLADPLIEEIMRQKRGEIDQKVEAMKSKSQSDQGQGKGKGQGEGDNLNVEGMDKQEVDMPASNPQEQGKKDHDKRTGGAPGDEDKTAGQAETADARRRREINGEAPEEGEPKEGDKPEKDPYAHKPRNALPMNQPGQGAGGQRSALEKIVLGDGRSYRDLRADPDYNEAVGEVANILSELSQRVVRRVHEARPERHDLPTGGANIIPRMDRERMRQLGRKLASGRANLDDFRTVQQEEMVSRPVVHDVVFLMDGSGSMGKGKGSRMEIAMKTAGLAYDAIRRLELEDNKHARYRLFMSLWGDEEDWAKDREAANKYLIAEPGMRDGDVEKRIERVLEGISSGTKLAPAFTNMLRRMERHLLPPGQKHGMTHFIIPSDGELFDADASRETIEHLLKIMPNATVDVMITANSDKNSLRDLITELGARYRGRLGIIDTEWAQAPSQMVELLKRRQRTAEPDLDPVAEEDFQGQLGAAARRSGMGR